jgi:hypothetical protein
MTRSPATTTQQAVRILALLRVCGELTGGNDPVGMVQAVRHPRAVSCQAAWAVRRWSQAMCSS